MKYNIILTTLILFSINLIAQENESPVNCPSFNSFKLEEGADHYIDDISESGIIHLNIEHTYELDGISEFVALLGLGQDNHFELVQSQKSRFNENIEYEYYQQFYKGVAVEGGGFTVSAWVIPGDPGNPCDRAYNMLFSNLYFDIELSVSPDLGTQNINQLINNVRETELVISTNLSNNCEYKLAYVTKYTDQYSFNSWVDANTGELLKTRKSDPGLNAPLVTPSYPSTVNLNDRTLNNVTSLITDDGVVRTFDYGNNLIPDILDLDENLIPTTTASSWTSEAIPTVYQSHWITPQLLPNFEALDITFGQVNVGSSTFGVTSADADSNYDKALIRIIGNTNSTSARFDMVAHELAHVVLFENNIAFNGLASMTVHEAVSDMIATYIESKIPGQSLEWIMGDDDVGDHRDIENPIFNCYDEIEGIENIYDRGGPYRRWFFLIVNGDSGNGIQGMGIDQAINFLLEVLNPVSTFDDYYQFRVKSQAIADDLFGHCAEESKTIRWAWNEVCVKPSNNISCNFSIQGPSLVDEEDNEVTLFAIGAPVSTSYRWYFPFGWDVSGASGNTYQGNILDVNGFPTYDWYPRTFTIKAILIQDPSYVKRHKITLRDRDGDDPTCEEYYNLQPTTDKDYSIGQEFQLNYPTNLIDSETSEILVYDKLGKVLFRGNTDLFNQYNSQYQGVLIVQQFNRYGELISTSKTFVLE